MADATEHAFHIAAFQLACFGERLNYGAEQRGESGLISQSQLPLCVLALRKKAFHVAACA
ncbi:MAG: hypothetical protein AAF636_19640 [Pseudomonadota bacterium]